MTFRGRHYTVYITKYQPIYTVNTASCQGNRRAVKSALIDHRIGFIYYSRYELFFLFSFYDYRCNQREHHSGRSRYERYRP